MAMTAPTTAWTDSEARAVPGRPLIEALGLERALAAQAPGGPALTVSLVGAGGKTTIAHALADELAARRLRIVITTTTKMSLEPALVTDVAAAVERLEALAFGGAVVAGAPVGDEKFGGFGAAGLAALRAACDVLIVEADGSRRMPIKVPGEGEPVVPDETDLLVLVTGLTSLGRPLEEVCCRVELVPRVLGEGVDRAVVLDAALAARLIQAGYLDHAKLAAWCPERTIVVLNQADDLAAWERGRDIAAQLGDVRSVLTTAAVSSPTTQAIPRG